MLNIVPFRQTLQLPSSGLIALGRVLVALVLVLAYGRASGAKTPFYEQESPALTIHSNCSHGKLISSRSIVPCEGTLA
jgi:hypothetical protein